MEISYKQMPADWLGTFPAPIGAHGMWLRYVYRFSIALCLDVSYPNGSTQWNKAPFIEFVAVSVR